MNYQEIDILSQLKFLSTNQRQDVLQFIDNLKGNRFNKKIRRRQAMMEIRDALNGED